MTVGTADANGSLANSIGSVTLRTKLNSAPTPDDVLLASQITDVRCQASESACGAANTEPGGGPDYSGELRADASLRITDRDNGSGTQPATVTDMDFPFTLSCAQTGTNQAIGSTCGVTTSANTLVPGSVQTNKRAIWELGPVQVFDGGSSGVAGASDATLFEYQGVFAP